ncbi:MAG: hypothetical protein DLM55_09340 [Acidimicrobiales bacterium]|nr:MAG: hypothetical protein DLM55_09340 [Acidimicrobiales bacterium]
MMASSAYEQLITKLERGKASYQLIDHAPEGRTDLVSRMRGNPLNQAAKCIVVMIKLGKKTKRYLLGVIPGDRRIDLSAIKKLTQASYVAFASQEVAERLSGSPSGTILPFSFHPELELMVDPGLLEASEIFFNAGRLDRSIALRTVDYVALAGPRMASIAESAEGVAHERV